MPIAASSTGTAVTVLATSEARTHLRVDFSDTANDAYIDTLIRAAVSHVEAVTGRVLGSKQFTWKMDYLCTDGGCLIVPFPPLVSVSSITYIDTDESTQTWGSTYYTVDTFSQPGRIAPAYQETWPVYLGVPNAVTVTFTGGYTSSSYIPADLTHAIKFIVAHLYENRQEVITGSGFTAAIQTPKAADYLLTKYQVPFFEGY